MLNIYQRIAIPLGRIFIYWGTFFEVHPATLDDLVTRKLRTLITSTALQWYMIAGTTAKPHLISCSRLSYTHYNKARHEFLTSSPNKPSIWDKTQMNRINRMLLPFLNNTRLAPPPSYRVVSCGILRLFMHLSANAPQCRLRGPIL